MCVSEYRRDNIFYPWIIYILARNNSWLFLVINIACWECCESESKCFVSCCDIVTGPSWWDRRQSADNQLICKQLVWLVTRSLKSCQEFWKKLISAVCDRLATQDNRRWIIKERVHRHFEFLIDISPETRI